MPKDPTYPTLYDDVLQLSISNLKKLGYLKPGQIASGAIKWSSNGNHTGSISIKVNTNSINPFIELDYKANGEPRNYKIPLVSIPSNLNKGKIWYFLCPHTNKRCRKLYSIHGYFFHREAFTGCMYETQTQSKKWRETEKVYGAYFDGDKLYAELYGKHFRKYYNGRPTKRYLKLREQIRQSEKMDYRSIERLLMLGK